MANTGYKNWLTLKKYINGVPTDETKANDVSDPDYIAPVLDLNSCPTPSNTCPQIDSAISDISVLVGASSTTIDLTTVFSDADGDTLSFSATSSNSAGVSATISGTNLIISYLSATSASSNISVTASDGTCSAVDSFTVTISATTTTTTTTTTAAPTYQAVTLYIGADSTSACAQSDSNTYYVDDTNLVDTTIIFNDSEGLNTTASQWFSDGTIAIQWNKTGTQTGEVIDTVSC